MSAAPAGRPRSCVGFALSTTTTPSRLPGSTRMSAFELSVEPLWLTMASAARPLSACQSVPKARTSVAGAPGAITSIPSMSPPFASAATYRAMSPAVDT